MKRKNLEDWKGNLYEMLKTWISLFMFDWDTLIYTGKMMILLCTVLKYILILIFYFRAWYIVVITITHKKYIASFHVNNIASICALWLIKSSGPTELLLSIYWLYLLYWLCIKICSSIKGSEYSCEATSYGK